jgi:hypothetical protein
MYCALAVAMSLVSSYVLSSMLLQNIFLSFLAFICLVLRYLSALSNIKCKRLKKCQPLARLNPPPSSETCALLEPGSSTLDGTR